MPSLDPYFAVLEANTQPKLRLFDNHFTLAADLSVLPSIAGRIKQGSLTGFDGGQGLMIGRRLADQLSVRAGDGITLVAPKGAVTPFGTAPRIKPYKVAAIFEMGMSEYDRTMIFMPLVEAQRYFSKGDTVDVLEVLVEDPDNVTDQVALMKQAGIADMHYSDWRQRNESFFTSSTIAGMENR